jgi:hypothetical protein
VHGFWHRQNKLSKRKKTELLPCRKAIVQIIGNVQKKQNEKAIKKIITYPLQPVLACKWDYKSKV